MNGAHAATGVLAGVGLATATGVSAAGIALAALVGAGAALLPDIDHDRSTITQSSGPLTRGVAELLQALARAVYRTTRGPHDPVATGKTGEHRGLIHTPAFAMLAGGLIALGTLLTPWAGIVVVYLLTSAAVRSLRWSLPSAVRTKSRLHTGFAPPIAAAAATYGLVQAGAISQVGPWLGLLVAVGMVVHSVGDGMTNSGIPFAWPLRRSCDRCRSKDAAVCPGARWDRQNVLPAVLRFSAGARRESLIEIACFAAAALMALPTLATAVPT